MERLFGKDGVIVLVIFFDGGGPCDIYMITVGARPYAGQTCGNGMPQHFMGIRR